jgi:hypothetical protein
MRLSVSNCAAECVFMIFSMCTSTAVNPPLLEVQTEDRRKGRKKSNNPPTQGFRAMTGRSPNGKSTMSLIQRH